MPSADRKLVSVPSEIHTRLSQFATDRTTTLGKAISILLDMAEQTSEQAKKYDFAFPGEGWDNFRYSEQASVVGGDGAIINLWEHNCSAVRAERMVNGKRVIRQVIIDRSTDTIVETKES